MHAPPPPSTIFGVGTAQNSPNPQNRIEGICSNVAQTRVIHSTTNTDLGRPNPSG